MKIVCLLFLFFSFQSFSQESVLKLASAENIILKTDVYSTEKALLRNLALELTYGHEPKGLSYSGLEGQADSVGIDDWVRKVSESTFKRRFLADLEPRFPEYLASKTYKFQPNYDKLSEFQNFFRWINRFEYEQFVLVNVAANSLVYYKNQQAVLNMKVIVGSQKNKTPIMASEADAVILYPYWRPTRNIALNEILPLVKKDIGYLERNSFEVLNQQNEVMSSGDIDWRSLDSTNFNYKFRQGTGCDNALGLLKINIKNPFSIYLHDVPHTTYSKSLFDRRSRFLSHGCIRLEKPLALANLLKPKKEIDDELLNQCLINEETELIELERPVPVFIMYFTDFIDRNGEWITVDDYYNLNKK